MSDRITECTVQKDGLSVLQYDVSYQVEHLSVTNNFCVVVKADGMTDSSDQNEAISLASIQARDMKNAWIETLPIATIEVVINEPQNVIL